MIPPGGGVCVDSATGDVRSERSRGGIMRNIWPAAAKAAVSCLVALVALTGCGSGGGSDNVTEVLLRVEVTPTNPSIAKGTTQQFVATAVYGGGRIADVTAEATWTSASPAVAAVSDAGGSKGLAEGLATGSAAIAAAYAGMQGTSTLTVTPAVPVSLQVAPTNPVVAKGTTRQFTATATFSDDSTQDVTATAVWTSSNTAVATVGNTAGSHGLAQALTQGTSTIGASYQGRSGTTLLTVTPAVLSAIQVTPTAPSIAKGTTQQFAATAVFSDSTTQDITPSATWTSSSPAVATVSDAAGSKGLAQAAGEGVSTIAAAFDGMTGSTTLTVSAAVATALQVTPTNPAIAKGTAQQFTATATFSDDTTQNVTSVATWTSSDTAVATVSNAAGSNGRAQSLAQGSTVISADYKGLTASSTLAVTAAVLSQIQVTPAAAKIPVGRTQQYAATGVFSDGTTQDLTATAAWTSSDPAVVEISNASPNAGLAAAKVAGMATVGASSGGVSGSTGVEVTDAVLSSIQLSPQNAKLAAGFERAYSATGLYSDGSSRDITADVTWGSSDSSIAAIGNASGSKGVASGVAAGTVSISAQLSGVSKATPLTVTNATLSTIQVAPADATMPLGNGLSYTATGSFSDSSTQDLTTQVAWSSSNPAIATISNADGSQGRAESVAVGGPVTISATAAGKTGSTSLTVSSAALVSISVEPPDASVPKGKAQQYKATGIYTDSSTADITVDVTWSSSNTAVATVSNAAGSEGRATGAAVGDAVISASLSGVTGSGDLAVTVAALESIAITSTASGSLPKGRTRQYTATGTYSDASTRNITAEVLWSSSDEDVATVGNSAADAGLASAVGVGTVDIEAQLDGVAAAVTLDVTDAVLQEIAITPTNPSVPAGLTRQLTATGTYSDGTTSSLTADVTWSSSNTGVAEISNGANSKGLALGKTQGSVTVTATDPTTAISGTTTLTVTAAVLQDIRVTPSNGTVASSADTPVGFGRQFTALGDFSDGVTRDITAQASWSSLDPTTISVGTGASNKGYGTALKAGTTTITASLSGLTGTATAAGIATTLNAIDVTPKAATFGPGDTLQYTATGTFANGQSLDVTREAGWTSSNTGVATVSNADGSKGLASAGSVPGTTTISATAAGKAGSTTLTRSLF